MPLLATQLAVRVTADTADAESGLKRIGDDTAAAADKASRWGEVWTGVQRQIGAVVVNAVSSLGREVAHLGEVALDSYASNERLGQSLEALVAKEIQHADATKTHTAALAEAAPKAAELVAWNQKLAIESPFTEEGVAKAFRMAQAYGFVSETASAADVDAKRLTQALIDFTAGSGQTEDTMNRIALALGQIQAKGKLSGQEVLQLVNAGVAVDSVLSQAFHKPTEEIVKMREAGLIPADQAIKAIVESMEKDFAGAAQKQATSMTGLIASLSDLEGISGRNLLGGIFQAAQPYLESFVNTLSDPQTQAQIQAFGNEIGERLAQALPVLVDGLTRGAQGALAFADGISQAYQTAQPYIAFISDNATPIVAGLGAGLATIATIQTVQAIPAAIVYTQALYAQAAAAAAAALPLAAIGVAIGAVVAVAADLDQKTTKQTESTLAMGKGWDTATRALDAYAQASPDIRETLSAEATALQNHRQALEENTKWQVYWIAAKALVLGDDAVKTDIADLTAQIKDQDQAIQQQATHLQQSTVAREGEAEALQMHNDHLDGLRQRLTNQAQGQQEVVQATQISTAELEKLNQALERNTQTGAQAYQALTASSVAYSQAETDRATKQQQQLSQIADDGGKRLADLDAQTAEKRASQAQSYQDKITDIATRGQQQAAAAEQRYQNTQAQQAEQHQTKLADIAGRAADVQASYQQKQADDAEAYGRERGEREQRYASQVADAQERAQQQAAGAAEKYQNQQAQAAQTYQDKLRDLAQRGADLREQYAAGAADREQTYTDKIAQLQEQAAQQAADRAQRYTDKLADMQQQAADRQRDAQARYDETAQNRADDHGDKLSDLRGKLNNAQTDVQAAAIQKEIDAENARYATQEARAQRAFERQQQQAAEQLQRQQAQLEQQRQRDEQAAAEKLARDAAQAAVARQRADQAAAEKLADQQRQLQREQQLQAEAYQRQQAEQAAAYAKQQADQSAALAEQLAKNEAAHAADLAAREQQYAREQALAARKYEAQRAALDAAVADEQASFATQREHALAAYAQQQADQQQKQAAQLADAQTAYQRQQAALAQHDAKERQQQGAAIADKRAARQQAYAEEEQQQATQYAKQQAQQRAALGQSLIAYVEKQREVGRITAADADALNETLRQKYGVRQSVEEAAYAASTRALDAYASGATPRLGDVQQSLDNVTAAAYDQQYAFETSLIPSVDGVARQFSDKKGAIDDYAQALRDIPTEITTNLAIGAALGAAIGAGIPGRAAGGPVSAGTLYRVNEQRTEYFQPSTGGTIIPLAGGGGGLGGSTVINIGQITVPGITNPREAAVAIREELIKMDRRNVGSLFGGG